METMKKKVDPSMQRLDWHHHPFTCASNTQMTKVFRAYSYLLTLLKMTL